MHRKNKDPYKSPALEVEYGPGDPLVGSGVVAEIPLKEEVKQGNQQDEDKKMKTLWWLSFADGNLPPGTQFQGACIVEGDSFLEAVQMAHIKGCDARGEVKAVPFSKEMAERIPAKWLHKLMSKKECEQFDLAIGSTGEVVKWPNDEDDECMMCKAEREGKDGQRQNSPN